MPHGSVLGPLFFLLYMNDLPKIITDLSQPVLIAEDTSLFFSNPSPMFLLRSSFYTLDEYFNWKLPKTSVPCKVILELNFITQFFNSR
jgi:hypothetical protein